MNLPNVWYTAGGCDLLWGEGGGTYEAVPYGALPPLEGPFDGSFGWLVGDARCGMRHEWAREDVSEEFERLVTEASGASGLEPRGVGEQLERLAVEASGAGLELPPSFVRFVRDESIHSRVPSCTACYWSLGARLVPVPGHEGPERLLRFMNDQQCCLLWYLLLEPGRAPRVVCAWPDWKDGEEAAGAESIEDGATPADVAVCAESFEEFVKRFWVENTIWFAASEGRALEGELAAYSAASLEARRARPQPGEAVDGGPPRF